MEGPSHSDEDQGGDEHEGMPRWVKVTLAVAVAVILMLLGLKLVVGVEHGPSRHGASSERPVEAAAGVSPASGDDHVLSGAGLRSR